MKLLLPLLCGALTAMVAPAWADVGRDDAAILAQRASGGRVLSVDPVQSARDSAWRVKVVTPQGEVRVVMVSAPETPRQEPPHDLEAGARGGQRLKARAASAP